MNAVAGVRRVNPLEQDVEVRLVAMLDAVGAPLGRREIFNRFDDDFVNEEDLARCLGRLVADGRLLRQTRPRFNKPDEAVYCTAAAARKAAIAAAAEHVQARPPVPKDEHHERSPEGLQALLAMPDDIPPPPDDTEPAAQKRSRKKSAASRQRRIAPPQPEKENDMGKKRKSPAEISQAVRDAVLGARAPLSLADVAKAAGVAPGSAKRALQELAKGAGRVVACAGKGRATRWQPAVAAQAEQPAAVASKPTPAKVPGITAPMPAGVVFAIESTGALAISSTTSSEKTRIEPADVSALAQFLAITRPIWESPAP